MNRFISIVLIVLTLGIPVASFAQEEPQQADSAVVSDEAVEQCRLDGRSYASQHYQGWRWFGAGFVGGASLGIIGAGIAIGFSQTGTAVPPQDALIGLQDQPQEMQDAFRLGYHKKARSKALGKCILGSVVGIGTIVTIMVATESD